MLIAGVVSGPATPWYVPAPVTTYVIRQGDYLSRVAPRLGLSALGVWNHPDNAALRERRGSMDCLQPGDVVHLPDAPVEGESLRVGQTNRFRGHPPTVEVRLVLRDASGSPLPSVAYRARAGAETEGQSDAQGRIVLSVPIYTDSVTLELDGYPSRTIRVGHMDPADEATGVAKRLANLGYFPAGGSIDDEEERAFRLRCAIEDFQRAQGLAVTGEADEATRDRLVDSHGS